MVAENQAKVMQFSTMTAQDNTMVKKLKFKITTKGIRDASEDKPHQDIMNVVPKKGDMCGKNYPKIDVPGKPAISASSCKRKPETSLDVRGGKRQKMDRGLRYQCANILKELMKHPDGWIFSEPVDPVKLQIPDYFSIITKPMDLGTIKRKLEGSVYFGAEEFASDVRLTFSNAMVYNPPENRVHHSAKILDCSFSKRWKLVEAKLKNVDKNAERGSFVTDVEKQDSKRNVEKNRQDIKPTGLDKAPLRIKLGTCKPLSIEEKRNFKMELVQLFDRKMMGNLQTLLQKLGLPTLNKEGVDSFINSTSDESLWKLRRDIKAYLDAKAGKARPTKPAESGCPSLKKPIQMEHCNKGSCEPTGHRGGSGEAKCLSCFSTTCHCPQRNGSSQMCASEISSERSSEHDHYGDSKLDSEVKHPVACHSSSFGVDSDGPGDVLNEENSPRVSTPTAAASSLEGWNAFNVPMSPKKALRAAMLKSRFADTIFRAKRQAILDNAQKSDPLRMQQERERLEKEQMAEKARIEAEIKAAKAASQREQDDMKMRREKERAAARKALQKMEKTVNLNENIDLSRELDKLGLNFPNRRGCRGGNNTPLEQLGLYIKNDYLLGDEYEDGDVMLGGGEEEGEIL